MLPGGRQASPVGAAHRWRGELYSANGINDPTAAGRVPGEEIKTSTFVSLLRRADALRRFEPDPMGSEWWAGYKRGLRRAHHGERFGSEAEHELWLAAADSDDQMRAALGRGYRARLTLEPRDPES